MVQTLLQEGLSLFSSNFPDVRNGNDVEVEFLVVVLKRGEMGLPEAIREANDAKVYPVIRTYDSSIAFCRETN